MILIDLVKVKILLKNTNTFLVASKEIGLEVNSEKKISIFSCLEISMWTKSLNTVGNKTFETIDFLKYIGTNLTNQNYIHETI